MLHVNVMHTRAREKTKSSFERNSKQVPFLGLNCSIRQGWSADGMRRKNPLCWCTTRSKQKQIYLFGKHRIGIEWKNPNWRRSTVGVVKGRKKSCDRVHKVRGRGRRMGRRAFLPNSKKMSQLIDLCRFRRHVKGIQWLHGCLQSQLVAEAYREGRLLWTIYGVSDTYSHFSSANKVRWGLFRVPTSFHSISHNCLQTNLVMLQISSSLLQLRVMFTLLYLFMARRF